MPPCRKRETYPYRPDYAVPPGWLVRDYLETWNFTPGEFARRNSLPGEQVRNLLTGDTPLDTQLAAILEREFDLTARLWLDMEADYRRHLAENPAAKGNLTMIAPTFKRFVCLANSRKLSGRCIAGKEIHDNGEPEGWIRPVSARETEEVSEWERQYQDGSDPRVLDIIDMPLLNARPKDYQQENWLLDPDYYWEKIDAVPVTGLMKFADQAAPLWTNGHSTANGSNDRIPLHLAYGCTDSLRLIRVERLELKVSQPGSDFGSYRRTVQGRFQHAGTDYGLRVTDPICERQYLRQPNGLYPIGECFLTVSLGEPYRGYVYKLIAAIIKA